jgi:hypothetical protein
MITKLNNWLRESYVHKNTILITGTFLLLFVAYSLAVSPTLSALSHYWELKKNIKDNVAPTALQKMQFLSNFYDKFIYSGNQNQFQTQLLEKVSDASLSYNSKLIAFSILSDEKTDNWHRRIYLLGLSGSYKSLIQTVHSLQKELSGGIAKSLSFEMEKDRVTRKNYLKIQIYIQSISNEEN